MLTVSASVNLWGFGFSILILSNACILHFQYFVYFACILHFWYFVSAVVL